MPPYAFPGLPVQARTSGMAIASLILGIVGLCSALAPIAAIPLILGIIFGHVALHEINKSGGMVQGKGIAIAGLALSYIGVGIAGLYIFTVASGLLFR